MSFTTSFRAFALLALAAFLLSPASAHSWIEEYQVIDTNGSYIGDRGYSRGYMARTDNGYNGFSMDYLVPQVGVRVNTSDSLCHPSQRSSNYSNPLYPKLKVTPGNYVAMKYLENGHVTLPWNQKGKPKAAGTVFVYGTTQPSADEKMADVLAWTSDGKGGNGKGWLMTSQNFDDGRCHQINCGNISIERQELFPAHVAEQPTSSVEQWCETDLLIPQGQSPGSLTTYWVWQWATAPNADCGAPEGKDEYYTTCADFDVIAAGSSNIDANILAEADTNTLAQEAPQSTAVSNFMSRMAYTTSPEVILIEGTSTKGNIVSASAAFMSSCSANAGVSASPEVSVPASCDPVSIFTGAAVAAASASVAQYATTPPLPAATAAAISTPPAPAPASSASGTAPSPAQTSTTTTASTTTTSMTTSMTSAMSSVTLQMTYISTSSPAGSSIAFPTISTISDSSAASSASTSSTIAPPATSSPMSSWGMEASLGVHLSS